MKKLAFLAAILVAGSVFAADFTDKTNSEIVSSIDSTDAKSLAGAAFEMRKRASAGMKEFKIMCGDFHNIMQNEMRGKTQEQKNAFMDEFHKELNTKVAALSPQDKANFDFSVCSQFVKNKKNGYGKGHHNGYKMNKHHFGQGCNQGGFGNCNTQDCPFNNVKPNTSEQKAL